MRIATLPSEAESDVAEMRCQPFVDHYIVIEEEKLIVVELELHAETEPGPIASGVALVMENDRRCRSMNGGKPSKVKRRRIVKHFVNPNRPTLQFQHVCYLPIQT